MPYNDWEWGLGNIQKFLLWDVQKFGPSFAVSNRQVIFRIKVLKLWSEPPAKDRRPSSYLNSGYFQQFWRATAGHFHIVRYLQMGLWNQSSLIFLLPPTKQVDCVPSPSARQFFLYYLQICVPHSNCYDLFFSPNKLFATRPFRQKCQVQDRQYIFIKLNWK